MKKLISVLMLMVMVFAFTACGGGASEDAAAEEDSQNPVMNYVGNYESGRASILIEADGDEGAKARVTWGSSASETSEWTMSGTFDTENLSFEYNDCVRKDLVFAESGEVEKEEEIYTGGHGFIFFEENDKLTLKWQDDEEHMADDMVFDFVSGSVSAE